jgi:dihydroorotase
VYDMATTVSKFLHLGFSLDEALSRVTVVPAQTIGMADRIGTLAVGAWGDAVVLGVQEGTFDLYDCHKQVRQAGQLLVPEVVIAGGRVYRGAGAPIAHSH